ncbi:tyrosyl-tRNA synthetase [Hortaea werneckii]|nr:tyrosyl-tRNA synthetase [Hortaea werneckii]KAI7169785.1 tyrosyl-tRNA synthetase [Hortaea werneckii]KAI7574442.1 tyrosyl-tRNA synthetase [Hortaea werneckii]KAI7654748.1 tyrosyl-tRNA synthetase [Hortaea werneckii]
MLSRRPSARWICARCLHQTRQPSQSKRFHNHAVKQQQQQQQHYKKSVLAVLEERGYINQIAGDRNALDRLLESRELGFYAGVDPTAPSLHLGHLLPFMVLFWLYHHGHRVVSLVGGATARVGDPSGRLTSRAKTAESVHDVNFETMFAQLGGLWENVEAYGQRHGYQDSSNGTRELLDNSSWLDTLNILDFLKLMGTGMRLGTMLGRDTVRNKMEKGDGMSFAEFTYPLLQGWDWWHMYRHHGVQLQIGGSDQYGNIVAGMDAVKYIAQNSASDGIGNQTPEWLDAEGKVKEDMSPMGLTVPLLTTSSGEKFGKSAGNAIWLDRSMTSAFDLYGFLLRSSDDDVERYLKLFTFVPTDEIGRVMVEHAHDPGKRKAQHLLASEVLELVHGRDEAIKTRKEHEVLRAPSLASLKRQDSTGASRESSNPASSGAERTILPYSLVLNTPISRILYHAGIASTKSEGARMIAKGGVYIATASAPGEGSKLDFHQLRDQKPDEVAGYIIDGVVVFRVGKWKVRVVEVVEDADFDSRSLHAPGWDEWKAIHPQK